MSWSGYARKVALKRDPAHGFPKLAQLDRHDAHKVQSLARHLVVAQFGFWQPALRPQLRRAAPEQWIDAADYERRGAQLRRAVQGYDGTRRSV